MTISKRKRRVFTFLVVFLFVLTPFVVKYRNEMCYVFAVTCFGVPAVPELDEIARIETYLTEHYHFYIIPDGKTEAGSHPGTSRLGGRVGGTGLLGKTPHTIIIWGITNKAYQDQIIHILKEYKKKERCRTIVIEFYRKENFVYRKTQYGRGGTRGPEELIRKENI
jgi:hypothetical protein